MCTRSILGSIAWVEHVHVKLYRYACITATVSVLFQYDICDPLWEKVQFHADYSIALCVKLAAPGSLTANPVFNTLQNYGLSTSFS